MTRLIQEGDIVSLYVSTESSIYTLVNHWKNPFDDPRPRMFKVSSTPSDTGDLWYLEGWIGSEGINLAVNQTSADFDAFVKRLDAVDARHREQHIAQEGLSI